MSKIIAKSLSVALLAALCAPNAFAASANLGVTATVSDNCIISTSAVNFGAYDPIVANLSSPRNGTGTVTVTCTSGADAAITLGQGANPDTGSLDDAPLRRMADGSNFLAYALYQDGSFSTVWGNDASTDFETTGTGTAQNLTVHGQIAPNQNVPQGSYSDTVVATVTF